MYRHTGTTQVTGRVITKRFDFGFPEAVLHKILVPRSELELVHKWLCCNQLSLNVEKSNYAIFHAP